MELSGTTTLLTGGTGSFGSAFLEYALARWPNAVIRVFSRDEVKQLDLRERLGDPPQLRWLIGDVRDRSRLVRAAQGCDFIVHAAAMKQVPACEYNPSEAVATNIIGSQNVTDAAIDAGVKLVVGLSTDKAVNPVNLYGATKLCSEKLMVQANSYAASRATRFSCVRYGNVVGSRGSVVPLFRRQAAEGLVTITDERMTRFWITLEQAVDLVLFALEHAAGGEVFIPKLPSVRVTDLAELLAPGVPTKIVGIRPGEKLHESLLTRDESRHTVDAGKHFVVLPDHPWWERQHPWMEGTPVPDSFVYTSDGNDSWLTGEALLRSLG